MKKLFSLVCIALSTLFIHSCIYKGTDATIYIEHIESKRKEDNQYFLSDKSPLSDEDKAHFKGMPYFDIKPDFLIEAEVEKISNPDTIKMNTSTGVLRDYIRYAKLNFSISDTLCSLVVYQSTHTKEVHYFLPFKDFTNGVSTYGAGRYLDLNEPAGRTYALDFNTAYNPYCAYSDKYSCPIPPEENHLKVAIPAGVRYDGKH